MVRSRHGRIAVTRAIGAGGAIHGYSLNLDQIDIMGASLAGFEVVCEDVAPEALVDGLIGLDFLRTRVLTIDESTVRSRSGHEGSTVGDWAAGSGLFADCDADKLRAEVLDSITLPSSSASARLQYGRDPAILNWTALGVTHKATDHRE